MTKPTLTAAFTLILSIAVAPSSATAQNEVLAELYGEGVHAYYAGDYNSANDFLTMAIDNGSDDPRVYYFRGLVAHNTGRTDEAEEDWKAGAALEANGDMSALVGKSLSRFQGAARLKLEVIRQKARLKALADAAKRSKARYGEIQQSESRVLRAPAAPPAAAPPAAAPPTATPPATAATPPAAVPPVTDASDPFADDMATGQPSLQSDDALKGAMENPFAADASIPAGSVPPNDPANPFGGNAGGNAADPFGGGAPAPGADPFGAGDAGGGADPFGGGGSDAGADPFGGGGDTKTQDDPFGGDPFGN